ncbi:MAG TPA: hypothetical protein VMX96_01925 [Dehalococcoidia bacterium]|nr:hypothetical protein [Dehalococcoidia bacterium]
MGRRDYRRREPKKSKKGTQQSKPISELVPQLETEVIKKKRKAVE